MTIVSLVSLQIGAINYFCVLAFMLLFEHRRDLYHDFLAVPALFNITTPLFEVVLFSLMQKQTTSFIFCQTGMDFMILIIISAICICVRCSPVSTAEKGIASSVQSKCLWHRYMQAFKMYSNGDLLLLPSFGIKGNECNKRQR